MTVIWARPDKFFGCKALSVAAAMYFVLTGLLLYSFPVFLPFLCKAFDRSRTSVSWENSWALIVQGIAGPLAIMAMLLLMLGMAIVIPAIGLISLILARPPVHPSMRENGTDSFMRRSVLHQ